MDNFQLPADTHIGYAHFLTADLNRAMGFYGDLMGFQVISRADGHATLSADGKTPHILLTERPGALPKPKRSTGLYHVAILLPNRYELSRLFRRMTANQYPLGGCSDHLVSEALYLDDPDGNGLELYRDRPRSEWKHQNGLVIMDSLPLDLDNLLDESENDPTAWTDVHPQTIIGHVHLHVANLNSAKAFYGDMLGLDVASDWSDHGALFMSAGGYHHHLGLNTWAGTARQPENTLGLHSFTLVVPEQAAFDTVKSRVEQAGISIEDASDDSFLIHDEVGNATIISR